MVAAEVLIESCARFVNAQSLLPLMKKMGSTACWVEFLSCLNMLQLCF